MTTPRKSDSEAIKHHIRTLKQQAWLGQARGWWPDFLFRFDNIDATAKILNSSKLLSRNAAAFAGVMATDSASRIVLDSTLDRWKSYVRLYFRPRTPTQYDAEGFRPPNQYVLGAHCPVPVVMLFDANDILTRPDAEFSDGNLAANASTGDGATFLESIPFEKVYHDSWLADDEKRSIVFHRHAEVIIPNELDLSALRFIGCRTQAEYETLQHLLDPKTRERWSARIGLGTRANLHFRRWTFVEQADLAKERIHFRFNPSTATPGPFAAHISIEETSTGREYYWENESYLANSTLEISLRSLKNSEDYVVRLTLNGQMAYSNHYEEYKIPF